MRISNKNTYEQTAKELVQNVLEPQAFVCDQDGRFPKESMDSLGRSGLLGMLIPVEYGGLGGSIRDFTRVTEIVAQGCVSTASLYLFHGQVARRIVDFGTNEQKEQILPKLATGEWLAASSWSELMAGSDKSGTKASADRIGESLRISGNKAYCTGAGEADLYTVLLRTDSEKGKELSFILLHKEDLGVEFGSSWNGMGLRASSTKEIICREVMVSRDRVLGEKFGRGQVMMAANRSTAIHPGILGLGIAKAAITLWHEHLKTKKYLWDFQNTRMVLSDLLIKVHTLEMLIYQAADFADHGNPLAAQVTMESKVLASQVAVSVTDAVMQMSGAQAYTRGNKVERLYRDAKAIGLMGPTTELSREYLAADWWKGGEGVWEETILNW